MPPTRRPRANHRVSPYPGAYSPSIAAVSAPSAACSMLVVQQQKRLTDLLMASCEFECRVSCVGLPGAVTPCCVSSPTSHNSGRSGSASDNHYR